MVEMLRDRRCGAVRPDLSGKEIRLVAK